MNTLSERFSQIITHNPSHKINRNELDKYLVGDAIHGEFVNFVHADVEAHKPIPGSLERFVEGFVVGGNDQAYTANRGTAPIRDYLASKLSAFYGTAIDPETELIITPGTQGALFCAMGSLVDRGDKVAFVEPDYHEYRPMVSYFGCEAVPIPLHWKEVKRYAGIDLELLEKAFKGGVKLFVYSNPNNQT